MKIGILGATGAVGQQMMVSLVEQGIKVDELRLLASHRSVGKEFLFKGEVLKVVEAKEDGKWPVVTFKGTKENLEKLIKSYDPTKAAEIEFKKA